MSFLGIGIENIERYREVCFFGQLDTLSGNFLKIYGNSNGIVRG